MTHTYHITGMTCSGCVASVTEKLLAVDGVEKANVDLAKSRAEVTMSQHVQIESLRSALPQKYSITEQQKQTETQGVPSQGKLQQLRPLFLILLYITIASLLLHREDLAAAPVMYDFMGLFFIVFSFFKMLDLRGFQQSFGMYDPLARTLPVYGWIYPFIETVLGLLFLLRVELHIALVTTIVVLGITTYGVTKTLLDRRSIQCACLGTALDLPMTEATFIENAIMIIMAVVMLFLG